MPVSSTSIGRARTKTNVITPRWALAYASSLGLTSDTYLDDSRGGALVIPPTFCVCLEWTLSDIEIGESLLDLSAEERRMGVHAIQDSRFFRPLRLGMSVTTTSTLVYLRRTRAGTFTLTRFDHADAATGEPLVTSYSGGMLRGVAMDADFAGDIPAGYVEPPEMFDSNPAMSEVRMDRSLPHTYSECARIWNPIHTERAVALAAGLPDIIVHGTITWALSAREVCKSVNADLGQLKRLAARFRSPIIAGLPMTVAIGRMEGEFAVPFSAANDRGDAILANGLVELLS
jgi:acyl dehydratase